MDVARPNWKMVQDKYKIDTSRWEISIPNWKLAQAIFLPGAWGKIPVFMGKNRPTPGAAMAFLHAQTTPPFVRLKKFF